MKKLLLTCSAIAFGALSPGFAQTAAPQSAPANQVQQTAPAATQDQTIPQGATSSPQTGQMGQPTATTQDLTGQTIYNSSGRAIGTVSSMTVDAQGQQEAVVGIEKYLGMGGTQVLFPVSSLQAKDSGGFTTTLTASEIKKLPKYTNGGSD